MDYSKQGINSETSSDENGRNSPEKLTDNSGTVRTYECAFCKRGFTNAQALGGHMNIHRKDKAKAKQKKNETTPNPSIDEDNMSSSRYFTPITNDQTHHHAALRAQMNYQFYFPVPNPSYPPPHAYYQSELTHRITSSENLGANLSLEIASSSLEDGQGKNRNLREDGMEYELDLELRLGHGPC